MQSDSAYRAQCFSMFELLVEASKGDPSSIPQNYLDNFDHRFQDGEVSLLPLGSHLTNYSELSPEEQDEVLEILHKQPKESWPEFKFVEEIDSEALLGSDFEAAPVDFVEDNLGTAEKVETVLKKVIESVLGGKVNSVRDSSGKFPSSKNNFLQEEDGTFSGSFQHENLGFLFEIAPTEQGWICTYRLEEKSLDGLPEMTKDVHRDKKEYEAMRRVRTKGWR